MSGLLKPALLVIACAGIGAYFGLQGPDMATRLTFLAVGQGDCAVFQTEGRTVLIDVGPNANGFDAGKRIVLPRLRSLGVKQIDLILLSHPDSDHTGGLGAILSGMKVGRIGISSAFAQHEGMLAQPRAERCMDKVIWLRPSQVTAIGKFAISVHCPEWNRELKDNDGSEFVKIAGAGCSAVFSGDASVEAEDAMLGQEDWSAQVLKLGHHGSRTSTSESWLQAVKPSWAIVSCGRNNTYGHPNSDVLERIFKRGIKIARTDQEGDVAFVPGPNGFQRELPR